MVAVWDIADQWHAAAAPVFNELLLRRDARLVTTTLVLYECGNAAARRPYRHLVSSLRKDLGLAGDLYDPTPDDLDRAWAAYARGEAGQAGIVDHVSFAVMRRLGVTDVFTNDRHFQAAGFTLLF